MSFLSRFRVLTKILAVIGLLSAVAAFIGYVGISSLKSLDAKAVDMSAAARSALTAARATQAVIALNRAEFRAALDPRDQNRTEARRLLDVQMRLFRERFEEVARTQDERARGMIPAVREAFAAYEKNMENTFRLAEAARDSKVTDAAERLRDAVLTSRATNEVLQEKIRAIGTRLDERVETAARESTAEYESASRLMIGTAVIGIAFGLLLGFLIGQYGVAKPIRAIVHLLQKLAGGDFNVEVAGTDRQDEVGDVAKTALVFKENGLAKIRMEEEQKDAERRAAAQRKADMEKLAVEFERAVGEIVQTVSSASTELEASATTLTRTAETTQSLSTTVAAASEQASANVQSVASASEEMASSVTEIGRQVQESSRISNEAVEQARKTDDRILKLSQAASRIGDVTQLITSIAEQTNLLALNATIEAARAGEAGKGFAVVAQEVKTLAAQTAKATSEISAQIAEMQSATQESVAAIKEIGGTIGRISEIATTIASAVEEQGAATQEITRNVQQASAGTTQVASNITDVSRGAAETGSASTQVLSSAQSLADESNRLKLEMGKFLAMVRAA
jgi:methyl-accepting chemotaxis protein